MDSYIELKPTWNDILIVECKGCDWVLVRLIAGESLFNVYSFGFQKKELWYIAENLRGVPKIYTTTEAEILFEKHKKNISWEFFWASNSKPWGCFI